MIRYTMLTLSLLAIGTTTWAQGITTHKITDSIYMLEGRGGNIGLSVGEDGILIIDSQFANMAQPIIDAIAKVQKGDIDFLINTHFHGDHTGGNQALAQNTPVIGHTNVRTRMARGKDLSNATFRNSLPTITYGDTAAVHFNGEDIQLKHYPTGHTDSDTVLYFPKANIMHMGDHFFVDRFPFIDLAGGGDVQQYMKNVQSLIDTAPKGVTIIPGHGPIADIGDLKRFLKLLADTRAIIQKGIDAGKDKKTLQTEGLPDKYKEAGTGFTSTKLWIGIVHDSLTR
jgi:cyclase